MISDTLYDAIVEIDRYLESPLYHDIYSGPIRKDIVATRQQMDNLRELLDTGIDLSTQEKS